MTMMSAGQAGYPAWVPRNAQLYLDHTESGLSFREIARAEGCHPSTVLRKIRAYENRRDDPLVDRGLARIGAAMQAQTADAAPPQPRTEGTDDMTAPTRTISLTDDATLRREARRVLRRLAEMRGDPGQARLNDPRFFSRMTGQGAWAQLIGLRFDLAVRRHGLDRHRLELRTDLFRRCPDERQLGLF